MTDGISCSDNTLQDTIGLVRANKNNICRHFEAAESMLIEVDPWKRAQKLPYGTGRKANISGVDFSAERGSYGVDLH